MRPRADSGARHTAGLLLALVLVASQASAWFHAVAISHVACSEHGEAVHGGAAAAPSPFDDGQPARSDNARGLRADLATLGGHDHCANAALLRWRDVALIAPVALAPLTDNPRRSAFAPSHGVARAAAVYLIAPKTSPPHASV